MRVSRFRRKMGLCCRSAALSLLIWTSLLPSLRAESAEPAPMPAALRSLLVSSGSLRIAERSLVTKPLEAFYRERDYAPVWLAGEAGSRRVTVTSPLPVYLLYCTAFVEDDGTMHFREDIYGRDRRIFRSLQDRIIRPAPEPDPSTCGD